MTGKEYWIEQTETSTHGAENFIKPTPKQDMLFEPILSSLEFDMKFLEVGCNAGVNCNYLWQKGFKNLYGFDINKVAVNKIMNENFPDMYSTGNFLVGDAIDLISRYEDNFFDVVFAKGTIIHIPNEEVREVIRHMCRISKNFVLFFEDEIHRLSLDFEMNMSLYHLYYKRRYVKEKDWYQEGGYFPLNHNFKKNIKTVSYYIKRESI